MKNLFYISFLLVLGCHTNTNKPTAYPEVGESTTDCFPPDSVFFFSYQNNFKDKNISNNSAKQIDLLFNGVDNYFGGNKNTGVHFSTECMGCEPIQEFQGGLLYAKRFMITPEEIRFCQSYYISDSAKTVRRYSDNREKTNPSFNFKEGTVSIKYTGVSCNDADFNQVKLSYSSGNIIVDSLINASFFEYDLDTDGRKEQYLLGTRNCSQEIVLLRIRDRSEK
jgi:hypothetical protein